jgi:hypothetical protein
MQVSFRLKSLSSGQAILVVVDVVDDTIVSTAKPRGSPIAQSLLMMKKNYLSHRKFSGLSVHSLEPNKLSSLNKKPKRL